MTCCVSLLLKNAAASDHATWGFSPISLWEKTQQSNAYGVTKMGSFPKTVVKCKYGNYLRTPVENRCTPVLRWLSCNHTRGRVYRTSPTLWTSRVPRVQQ